MKNVLSLQNFSYLLIVIFSWKICLTEASVANQKFCEEHCNLTSNSTGLRFCPHKPNYYQYVNIGESSMIHCCAAEYDSIEWYKDDKRITNISSSVTTFTLLSESPSNNQTISSRLGVEEIDKGIYKCIIKKGSKTDNAVIHLNTTYQEHVNKKLEWIGGGPNETQCGNTGDSLTVVCEAYIGKISGVEIWWLRPNVTGFIDDLDENNEPTGIILEPKNCNVSPSSSNDGRIKCTLLIPNISSKHYGEYSCNVSYLHMDFNIEYINRTIILEKGTHCKPNITLWYESAYLKVIICFLIFIALFIMIVIFIMKWKLEIRLFLRHQFGKIEDNDAKTYDVFICYDPVDGNFIHNILVPTLENNYNYSCFVYERDIVGGTSIPELFSINVQNSRRFVMIISPAVRENTWLLYSLYLAVKAVLEHDSKIICIVLKDIPWSEIKEKDQKPNDKALKQILKFVKRVDWEPGPVMSRFSSADYEKATLQHVHKGSRKFWKSLLLHLPPKRYGQCWGGSS